MNSSNTSKDGYLLIFRGTEWSRGMSPEEMQQVATAWKAWYDRLAEQGKVAGGNPLEMRSKIVSARQGRTVVADGPFSEAKETVGGYFLLTVTNEAEALAIAQRCPGLPYGAVVEVRPIAEACPLGKMAERELVATV